jgi:CHAT domain-containing protein
VPKLTAEQRARLREHDALRLETSKLRMAGKLDEATANAEKMAAIDREVFGKSHPLVAQALVIVAEINITRHDFTAARRTCEEILAIDQEWGGADHWRQKDARRMLDRVNRLATLDGKQLARLDELDRRLRQLAAERRYEEAGPLLEELLALQKELLGEKHQDLNSFAILAGVQQGRSIVRAEELWRKALEICKATRGEEHPEYARTVTQLGALLTEKGGREQARSYLDRASRIYLVTLGAFDLDYAPWALHLARMQGVLLRQTERAEPLVRVAAEIYEACRGDTDPQYAECLSQLGHMHYNRGSYAQAEQLFKQVIEIRKASVGDKHPQYAQSLLALAMVYHAKGSHELAEPLYAQANRIQDRGLKSALPQTAVEIRDEAARQSAAGKYAEAEKLYKQLLDLDRKTAGTKSSDYANDLWRLAGLYQSMRANDKAEALYEEAAESFKEAFGDKHRWYRMSLESQARLVLERQDYPKAEALYRRLEALYRETEGDTSFRYGMALDQQGEVLKAQGELDKAAVLFEKSLPIFKARLGPQGLVYRGRLSSLATLYAMQGNEERALALMQECVTCHEKELEELFSFQSERQRMQALRLARRSLDQYVNMANTAGKASGPALYQHVLRWKGAAAARQQVRLTREQPELKELFDRLAQASTSLTELAYAPPSAGDEEAWARRVNNLRNDKENLESEIARRSESFRWERQGSQLEPAAVVGVLPEGAVFVDFFEYSGPQQEQRLLAFALRRGREPVAVEIEGYKGILRNIESWRSGLLLVDAQKKTAAELREKLWKPLEVALAGASTVLVAPDGGLGYFPLAVLPGKQPNTFLIEDLAIGYVTSGRQVVETLKASARENGSGLLAIGGIDYAAEAGRGVVRLMADGGPLVDSRTRAGFTPLPGTALEAKRCQELFKEAYASERATLLTGAAPTEARLVQECGERYRYLHLATHGFFESPLRVAALVASNKPTGLSDSGRAQALARLPLLRSGLALAGAGRPPRPGDVRQGGGILTAEEVAAMDLRAMDLAVLSACETGIGEIERGEGVLGLQRAFHQAGTRTLVTTLWSVDDAATSVLMEELYTNLWQRKMPKLEALRQAQLTVLRDPGRVFSRRQELKKVLAGKIREADASPAGPRQKEQEESQRSNARDGKQSPPFWWAAFVLSGDPF